jgi:acyl-CoA synthetase (AMP-forming)/AMP-acid ligase II
MMRRFDLQVFLQTIEKYNVTEMALVPPIVLAIVMSPFTKTRPFLKSVRTASCGAAPLDKGLQARLLQLMSDGASFNQVWGMTETSCIATLFPYNEHDDTGSVGRPIPNLELKYIANHFNVD